MRSPDPGEQGERYDSASLVGAGPGLRLALCADPGVLADGAYPLHPRRRSAAGIGDNGTNVESQGRRFAVHGSPCTRGTRDSQRHVTCLWLMQEPCKA